jgi:hypothetical protein
MSRSYHNGERHIRVHGDKRDPVELRRLARALIALAQAQAEAEAEGSRKSTPIGKAKKRRNHFDNSTNDHGDAA